MKKCICDAWPASQSMAEDLIKDVLVIEMVEDRLTRKEAEVILEMCLSTVPTDGGLQIWIDTDVLETMMTEMGMHHLEGEA